MLTFAHLLEPYCGPPCSVAGSEDMDDPTCDTDYVSAEVGPEARDCIVCTTLVLLVSSLLLASYKTVWR